MSYVCSSALVRSSGRALEGMSMQKIDPAFLFELGSHVRRVRTVAPNMVVADAYLTLDNAATAIDQAVNGSVYSHLLRPPCRIAAANLIEHMRAMVEGIKAEADWSQASLDLFDVTKLGLLYPKFETLFLAELQAAALYLVSPKGGFDTAALIELGGLLFSNDLAEKVPAAIPDLEQATRCIAFELATAAGFHLHRAHESVLRTYWDCVTGGEPRPEENNMGVYLRQLEKLDKGRPEVRSHLKSIKNFHRNPLMHPEQTLDNVDQALDLLAAIRCSIGYMLQEIPSDNGAPLLENITDEATPSAPV